VETTDVLLRAGVSRDTRTKVDRTPLHVAAQEGHLEIVSLLLSHGADVDAKDLLKMTPLHWAVERGHTDVVECLLSNGADVNGISKFDKTPIDVAIEQNRMHLVPLLKKHTNVLKVKPEIKSPPVQSAKARPTVLPNKANRTAKITKPQQSGSSVKQIFLSNGTSMKNLNVTETLKKLISNGGCSSEFQAILAALAESQPTNSPNSSRNMQQSSQQQQINEAVQWLESEGLTNSTIDEDTIIQSAIQSGQTVNLTEAGKMALNLLKQEQNPNITTSTNSQKGQTVIKIVDGSSVPQIINNNQANAPNIVYVSSSTLKGAQSIESRNAASVAINSKNRCKFGKPVAISSLPRNISVAQVKSSSSESTDTLRSELDACRKELASVKTKLADKERECEKYKTQLKAFSNGKAT